MTVFIAVAVVLTLLAVAWMVRPLLRAPQAGVSSQRLNAAIYRDQLETLERDLARAAINAADYEATRDELQLRLLDDTEAPPVSQPAGPGAFWTGWRTATVMAVLLPLASAAMYGWLGNPAAMNPVAAQKVSAEQIVQMVDTLAARLQANPDNPKGWVMLARSYKAMGRLDEAEQAFLKAGEVVNADPDLLLEYADLLIQRADNRIEGRPLELVNLALSLDPRHRSGLMMSGAAAYQRADFAGAIAQWEKVLAMLEPGSPDARQIEASIEAARAKGGPDPQGKTKP